MTPPPHNTANPAGYEFQLVPATWSALCNRIGADSNEALAGMLKLSRSAVSRVMDGTQPPSARFMAHAVAAFPFASFDKLFTLKAATR